MRSTLVQFLNYVKIFILASLWCLQCPWIPTFPQCCPSTSASPFASPHPAGIYTVIAARQFTSVFCGVSEFVLLQFLIWTARSSLLCLTCPVPPVVQCSRPNHHHCRICGDCQRSKTWDWSHGLEPFLHWPEGRETSVSICNMSQIAVYQLPGAWLPEEVAAYLAHGFQNKTCSSAFAEDNWNSFAFTIHVYQHSDIHLNSFLFILIS